MNTTGPTGQEQNPYMGPYDTGTYMLPLCSQQGTNRNDYQRCTLRVSFFLQNYPVEAWYGQDQSGYLSGPYGYVEALSEYQIPMVQRR